MIKVLANAAMLAAVAGLWFGIDLNWWAASLAWTATALLLLTHSVLVERRFARWQHWIEKVAIPALKDDKKVAVDALTRIERHAVFGSSTQRAATAALDELEISRPGRQAA